MTQGTQKECAFRKVVCSKQLKYSLNSFNKQVRLLLCILSRFKTQVNLLKLLGEEEEREEEREEIVNE